MTADDQPLWCLRSPDARCRRLETATSAERRYLFDPEFHAVVKLIEVIGRDLRDGHRFRALVDSGIPDALMYALHVDHPATEKLRRAVGIVPAIRKEEA